jgi:hypothetical protein
MSFKEWSAKQTASSAKTPTEKTATGPVTEQPTPKKSPDIAAPASKAQA